LTGAPYFVVNHVDDHDAVLMTIGRLRYEEKAKDGTWRKVPRRDYWLGTSAILDLTEGKKSGRMGTDPGSYPVNAGYDVYDLIYPELPNHVGDERRTGGTISVTRGTIGPGAPPLITTRGKQTFTTRATSLGGSRVQLLVEKRFDNDNGDVSLNRSEATFDHRQGVMLDHVAKRTPTKNGATYAVTMNVRRISGTAFEKAKQLAMEDAKSMPKKMEPVELMRTRLDLRLPKRYGADDLPAPGTVVGYYDSEFPVHRSWYAVKFVKRIGTNEVLVRYVGSGETDRVHPGQLAKLGR
jgi:hypothetical protein